MDLLRTVITRGRSRERHIHVFRIEPVPRASGGVHGDGYNAGDKAHEDQSYVADHGTHANAILKVDGCGIVAGTREGQHVTVLSLEIECRGRRERPTGWRGLDLHTRRGRLHADVLPRAVHDGAATSDKERGHHRQCRAGCGHGWISGDEGKLSLLSGDQSGIRWESVEVSGRETARKAQRLKDSSPCALRDFAPFGT